MQRHASFTSRRGHGVAACALTLPFPYNASAALRTKELPRLAGRQCTSRTSRQRTSPCPVPPRSRALPHDCHATLPAGLARLPTGNAASVYMRQRRGVRNLWTPVTGSQKSTRSGTSGAGSLRRRHVAQRGVRCGSSELLNRASLLSETACLAGILPPLRLALIVPETLLDL
ncbi:hypothetical protein OH77DRAFT_1431195 [Trametes cingulata]|nr:hypothetical protein OH77DRAFT_1431195 [Trametes cingulata]